MASLGEVVGALISQISKGRSQADMATLEVAKVYKEHPLLSSFPVPKMTLDEVVIDLKVSISAAPERKVLSAEAKREILAEIEKMTREAVTSEPSLQKLSRKFPDLSGIMDQTHPKFMERLSELLPEEKEIEPKSIAQAAASVIRGHLTDTVLGADPKVVNKLSKDFLQSESPQLEAKLASQIQAKISGILEVQPIDKERLEVLVTASELQSIPPEKITTLRLTLREADQSWTQIETEKGEVQEKLVPH